ncbi:MAG: hypothetical protein ACTSP4_02845, partial [Candidatus Hodarchaeales archaeon]
MVAAVFSLLNQSLLILSLIPFIFVLIFDYYQKEKLESLFGHPETEKRVFTVIILFKTMVAIIPALILNLVIRGIGFALKSVLDMIGVSFAFILIEGILEILSVLLLWPIFNWLIPHLEEISRKETGLDGLTITKILVRMMILSLPAIILFVWGYILFIHHYEGSLVVITSVFAMIAFILLIVLLLLDRSLLKRESLVFTRKTLVFELLAVIILLLAFLPLLFWIEWIDSASLGLIIRKSGEMGMHPEIP